MYHFEHRWQVRPLVWNMVVNFKEESERAVDIRDFCDSVAHRQHKQLRGFVCQ